MRQVMRNTRALMSLGLPRRLMFLLVGGLIGVCVIPTVWTLNATETDCRFPVFEELTGDLYRPKIIPANATCVWSVVPKSEYIESWTKNEPLLVFKSVVLERSDRLSIVDSYGDVIFGPYPGNEVPFSILPRVLHFSVVVNTSQRVTNHKRHLWAFVDMKERSYTHHQMSSENGESVLESPVYSTGALFDLIRITYKIPSHRNRGKTNNPTKLAVVFETFNFTGGTYVQVSGSEGNDGTYDREGPPDLIVPSSGTLVLTLFLDCSEAEQRFRVLLRPTSAECSEAVLLDEKHSQRIISFSGESLASVVPSNPVICTRVVKCPKKSLIRITILEEVRLASALDLLAVNEAGSMFGSNILLITTESAQHAKGRVIISSTEYIWLHYSSPSFAPGRMQTNIFVKASLEKFGGIYRVTSGGSVNISYLPQQIDFSQSLVPDVTFLLEVVDPPSVAGSDDIAIVTFPLPFEAGPDSAVWIYPSHNEQTAPAAILKDLQTSGQRVLVSSSRAMIVLKKFSNVQAFLANFTAVPKALNEADETDNASASEHCNEASVKRNSSDDADAHPENGSSSKPEPLPDRYSGIPVILMSAGGGFLLGITLTAVFCCAKTCLRRRRRRKLSQRLEESVQWKPQDCYDD